eukprot:g1800.t1
MGEMFLYDALASRGWTQSNSFLDSLAIAEEEEEEAEAARMAASGSSGGGESSPVLKRTKKRKRAPSRSPTKKSGTSAVQVPRRQRPPLTLDDVDACFKNFKTLNFQESLELRSPGGVITATPFLAGHMLGGAVWRISKETDSIVYAVDVNHQKDRHLDRTALGTLQNPTALITDCVVPMQSPIPSRTAREQRILDVTLESLRGGGNVLLPCDSGGRVLEMLLLFDQEWGKRRRGAYRLALVHHSGESMVDFAQSQLQYMSDELSDQFNMTRNNAFNFKYVHICHSHDELEEIPSPKVVFATTSTLDRGFAHDLFGAWAANPRNCVLLTSRSEPGSVANRLARRACTKGYKPKQPFTIAFKRHMKKELDGLELGAWNGAIEREKKRKADEVKAEEEKKKMMEFKIGDEDGAVTEGAGVLALGASLGDAISATAQMDQHPMFAFAEEKLAWDEYGEVCDVTPYMDKFALHGVDNSIPSLSLLQSNMGNNDEDEGSGMESDEEEIEEAPFKYDSEMVDLEVKCAVIFIDLEGLSDPRSKRMLISSLSPRRVILVHGHKKEIAGMSSSLKREKKSLELYTPGPGEEVVMKSETKLIKAKLDADLMVNLQLRSVAEYEVAKFDAEIRDVDGELQLVANTRRRPPGEEGSMAVGVGDTMLYDFRKTLQDEGMRSEMRGKMLLCEDGVFVRKNAPHDFSVEGPLCQTYYKVRELFFKLYTFLV